MISVWGRRPGRLDMKKVLNIFLLLSLAISVAITGCVSTKYRPAKGVEKYPPTDSLKVLKNYPERTYTVIGTITAIGRSEKKIMENIKKRAMKAGAHAIVVKPPARIASEYTSQMRTEFRKSEWKYEAVFIRFEESN